MKIVAILLIFITSLSFCQTPAENQLKYWYYRDRLKWFVMPGYEHGQSIVSNLRNRDASGDCVPSGAGNNVYFYSSISFGQEWTQMGMYIGLLATEYRLLKDNGQFNDANNTLIELNKALFALIRMDKCEDEAPWYQNEEFDGFFVREDAPPVMNSGMVSYFNQDIEQPIGIMDYLSSGYYGKPAWIDPTKVECVMKFEDEQNYFYNHRSSKDVSEYDYSLHGTAFIDHFKVQNFTSQDEVLGVLIGLTLTAKLVDDQETYLRARLIASKLISFLANCENCGYQNNWMPCFPDGDPMGNNNGGDARGYAAPLKKTMNLIETAQNFSSPLSAWYENEIHHAPNKMAAYNANLAWTLSVRDVSNRNLLSRAIAMGENGTSTFMLLNELSGNEQWDVMFHLLWSTLYDKNIKNKNYNFNLLKTNLDIAPCGGPYLYLTGSKYSDYWATDNKWSAAYSSQHGGEITDEDSKLWTAGNFPGLDYMLLYNLACLSFPEGFPTSNHTCYFPYYVNQINRQVSAYYPQKFPYSILVEIGSETRPEEIRAITSISSDMVVSTQALNPLDWTYIPDINGDVTLKASESIKLTDGFRVDEGAHFLARIESYSCGGLSYKNLEAPPWDENYRGCFYDTLVSIPIDKRAPKVYSEDDYLVDDFDTPLWDDYYYTYDTTSNPELEVGVWLNPNPCRNSSTLTLVSENDTYITIELFDMGGQKRATLFEGQSGTSSFELNIDMSLFAKGMYVVRITGDGGMKVLKIVKE